MSGTSLKDIVLSPAREALLRKVAARGGSLPRAGLSDTELTAAAGLRRKWLLAGMETPTLWITKRGRQWLAANPEEET